MTQPSQADRRAMIKSAVALGASAGMLGCTPVVASPERGIPATEAPLTFLLVHGAWHGGWCWRDVRTGLEGLGHRVLAPTLTGLADRAHLLSPEVGLQTHITDIMALIAYEDLTDIVLVGHSYGGMVITGVADAMKDRIRHIIYIDAALPENGQTMVSQGPPRSPVTLERTRKDLAGLAPDGIAMAAFPPSLLGIPPEHPRYAWVEAKLTPHPLKTWLDPIALPNGGSDGLKRTYIHCTDPVLPNSSFAWHAEQVQKDSSWAYYPVATGHDAMVTAPEKLVDIFRKA